MKFSKIKKPMISVISSVCVSLSGVCFATKLPKIMSYACDKAEVVIAKSVFSNGVLENFDDQKNEFQESEIGENNFQQDEKNKSEMNLESNEEPDSQEFIDQHKNEKTYRITETQFGQSGIIYDNFCLRNSSKKEIDISNYLKKRPSINIKKTNEPQVLIVHTHTTEGYIDKDRGFFYESYTPRTLDNNFNVTKVGDEIQKELEEAGIGVIHDKTVHDNPSYNGSYGRSSKTVKKNLEKYPSIQMIFDIHRDSLGENESAKLKPTCVINGKKAAQIMILAGHEGKAKDFPNWESNLSLALRLQKGLETMYQGITRPIYFDEMKYNMHMHPGYLLIEMGSDVNTIAEATYSGYLLGNTLVKVIEELQED